MNVVQPPLLHFSELRMFITDAQTPVEVLAEMLKGRRSSVAGTQRFKKLRHDRDLLPQFEENIEAILDVFKAYRSEAHDMQGMRDDGVDILLKYEEDGSEHRVGLQIKSNDEFEKWVKKKLNLVEKLKAQYAAAIENTNIHDYYIILCAYDREYRSSPRTAGYFDVGGIHF
jgi:hypothetical protein